MYICMCLCHVHSSLYNNYYTTLYNYVKMYILLYAAHITFVYAQAASNDPRRFASRLQMFSRQVEVLGVNATKRPCACCDFGGWGGGVGQ